MGIILDFWSDWISKYIGHKQFSFWYVAEYGIAYLQDLQCRCEIIGYDAVVHKNTRRQPKYLFHLLAKNIYLLSPVCSRCGPEGPTRNSQFQQRPSLHRSVDNKTIIVNSKFDILNRNKAQNFVWWCWGWFFLSPITPFSGPSHRNWPSLFTFWNNIYLHQDFFEPTYICTNIFLHQHISAPTFIWAKIYLHQDIFAPRYIFNSKSIFNTQVNDVIHLVCLVDPISIFSHLTKAWIFHTFIQRVYMGILFLPCTARHPYQQIYRTTFKI